MQQCNFIDVFLAQHVYGAYAHHQEHQMLSCSIWFSAPSLSMSGGLESRCVGRVCGADCAVHASFRGSEVFYRIRLYKDCFLDYLTN